MFEDENQNESNVVSLDAALELEKEEAPTPEKPTVCGVVSRRYRVPP